MAFVKKHRQGTTTYYELVEGYRDENGKVRHRSLRWLGRNPNPAPDPIPLKGVDFADLAVKLMEQSLTVDDVFRLLQEIGKRPADVAELEAVGIRFEFAQKKLLIYLLPKGYDWKLVPRRAPRAKAGSAAKGRTSARASSPSKAKPK